MTTDVTRGKLAAEEFGPGRRALAWSVHAFTAGGLLTAFLALEAMSRREWREAFLWLAASVGIDGLDGALARLAQVRRVLPGYDGRMLDFVADFVNFVFLPAWLLYEAGLVPEQLRLAAVAAILLTSAYHFGNMDAVTEDYHFKGFPAFWNLVVFYLFIFELGPAWNLAFVLLTCVLHFVPIRFVYPTRATHLRRLTMAAAAAWVACSGAILLEYPEQSPVLRALLLLILGYMGGMSLYQTFVPAQRLPSASGA